MSGKDAGGLSHGKLEPAAFSAAAGGVATEPPRAPSSPQPSRAAAAPRAVPVLVETFSPMNAAGSAGMQSPLVTECVATSAAVAAFTVPSSGSGSCTLSSLQPAAAGGGGGDHGSSGGRGSGGDAAFRVLDAVAASSDAVAKLRQMATGWETPSTTTASSSGHHRLSAAGSELGFGFGGSGFGGGAGGLGISAVGSMASGGAGCGGPTEPAAAAGLASGLGRRSIDGGGGGGRVGPPPGRVFRRDLYSSEVAVVAALLDAPGRKELRQQAAREFEWALSVSGHVPGRPGRVDHAAALTALRQLAYLNGLPSLDSGAAGWFFGAHVAGERSPMGGVDDITSEEFQAAVEHLMQYAVAGSQS